MQTEDDLRRRRMMQQALDAGLQRPQSTLLSRTGETGPVGPSSFAPGESAGVPTGIKLDAPSTPPRPLNSISFPDSTGPPNPSEQSTQSQPSPRIGFSTAGLTGLEKIAQRREALEEADPESEVKVTPDFIETGPPAMKGVNRKGRFRAGLEASLSALAHADPDRPLYSLGQGIGGLLGGVASPRTGAKIKRHYDILDAQTDEARGLKLAQEQAQLDQMRGPKSGQMTTRVVGEGEYPGIEAGTEIRVRVDPRTGGVVDVVGPNDKPVIADLAKRPSAGAPHYESDSEGYLITVQGGVAERVTDRGGNPVKVKSKDSNGEVIEVEVNGRTLKVTPGQALNYYGQIGERESKSNAARAEYDQLVEDEKKAGAEKNAAYSAIEQFRKDHPSMSLDDVDVLRQMEDEAKRLNTIYQSFAEKKRDAQRKVAENATSSGKSLTPELEAQIRAAATAAGLDPEIAVQRARQRP